MSTHTDAQRRLIDDKLDEGARALEDGDAARAEALADEILTLDGKLGGAWHLRACALVDQEKWDDADSAFERALEVAPDDVEVWLGAASFWVVGSGEDPEQLERGLAACRKGLKVARKAEDVEMIYELLLLEGIAYNGLGLCRDALRSLDEALTHMPRSTDAGLERAMALFELGEFDRAQAALLELLKLAPNEPWVHHTLGLIVERRQGAEEAERWFARARELSPDEFPAPVKLSDADFDAAVRDALAQLPEDIRPFLDNVTVTVDPLPSEEDLKSSEPPHSPTILGLFKGTPIGERSVSNAYDHFPSAVVLYQRNLERFARDREELVEEIGVTVAHEVGHLVGLDEDELKDRGLD
jgi:predicted Zn-dependent protease with MMP-like domain/Tfp pilus assembly protein PilF